MTPVARCGCESQSADVTRTASTTRTRSVAACVVAATSLAGCTISVGAGGDGGSCDTTASGSKYVLLDSVSKVVTWTDTVAVVTVLSEEEAVSDHSGEDAEDAGPLVGRRVEVRIDEVVWSRPSGEQPPSRFTTQAPGWVREDDGSLTSWQECGGVRVDVGETYLAPIIFIGEWGFDTDELLAVKDGQLEAAPGQGSAWALGMDALSVDQAAQMLREGEPHRDAGLLAATTEEQLAEQLRDLQRERRQQRRQGG